MEKSKWRRDMEFSILFKDSKAYEWGLCQSVTPTTTWIYCSCPYHLLYSWLPCVMFAKRSQVSNLLAAISDFAISHVEGHQNVFADDLSRWANGKDLNDISLHRNMYDEWICQSRDEVDPEQGKLKQRGDAIINESGVGKAKRFGWIPDERMDLGYNILVLAHCEQERHRWIKPAKEKLIELCHQVAWRMKYLNLFDCEFITS